MSYPTAQLRILETTDLHMHVLAYDYFADRPAPGIGLRQLACLVDTLALDAVPTLLCDNGDFLQGNPLADYAIETAPKDTPHPMIAAMNLMGYDAVALGNHEFNYGLAQLRAALSFAEFPVLCANMTEDGRPVAQPTLIVTKDLPCSDGQTRPLRIGLFGVVPPQVALWDHDVLQDSTRTADIVETAKTCTADLRAKGADIVVALCHSGFGDHDAKLGQENAVVPVAALEGIDVVLAGHTHECFPDQNLPASGPVDPQSGTVHGKPVVQAGFNGRYVGQIDCALTWDGTQWSLTAHKTQLVQAPADPAPTATAQKIETTVARAHTETLQKIKQPVAQTALAISSHFTMLQGDPALQLLAQAQRNALIGSCPDRDWGTLPVVSAVSPFLAGGRAGPQHYINIPAGPIFLRDASAIYPFSNSIYGLRLSGKAVRQWLDRAARVFNHIHRDAPQQALLGDRRAPYYFDMLYGLTYEIDLGKPRDRITRLAYEGVELSDDDHIIVATNSYRANGGGGLLSHLDGAVACRSEVSVRDALVQHLNLRGHLAVPYTPPWTFAPMGGTEALFYTAPEADPAAVRGYRVSATGQILDGFGEFTVTL